MEKTIRDFKETGNTLYLTIPKKLCKQIFSIDEYSYYPVEITPTYNGLLLTPDNTLNKSFLIFLDQIKKNDLENLSDNRKYLKMIRTLIVGAYVSGHDKIEIFTDNKKGIEQVVVDAVRQAHQLIDGFQYTEQDNGKKIIIEELRHGNIPIYDAIKNMEIKASRMMESFANALISGENDAIFDLNLEFEIDKFDFYIMHNISRRFNNFPNYNFDPAANLLSLSISSEIERIGNNIGNGWRQWEKIVSKSELKETKTCQNIGNIILIARDLLNSAVNLFLKMETSKRFDSYEKIFDEQKKILELKDECMNISNMALFNKERTELLFIIDFVNNSLGRLNDIYLDIHNKSIEPLNLTQSNKT